MNLIDQINSIDFEPAFGNASQSSGIPSPVFFTLLINPDDHLVLRYEESCQSEWRVKLALEYRTFDPHRRDDVATGEGTARVEIVAAERAREALIRHLIDHMNARRALLGLDLITGGDNERWESQR